MLIEVDFKASASRLKNAKRPAKKILTKFENHCIYISLWKWKRADELPIVILNYSANLTLHSRAANPPYIMPPNHSKPPTRAMEKLWKTVLKIK